MPGFRRNRSSTASLLSNAIATVALISATASEASAASIKVACVGEQTTHSDQLARKVEYPAILQTLLGACADVQNFGDCCATILQGYPTQAETHPYLAPPAGRTQFIPGFHESVAYAPEVVVIGSWGKHDTEIANSLYGGKLDPVKWQADYEQLVTTYLNLPSKPTVYVSTPLPIPSGQAAGVTTSVILPAIQSTAAKYHLGIVPLYEKFLNQPQLYKDSTHPTDVAGLQTIADAVYSTITGGVTPAADAGCGGGLISTAGADAAPDAAGADNGDAGVSGSSSGSGTAAPITEDGSVAASANDAALGTFSPDSGKGAAAPANASGCACRVGAGSNGLPPAIVFAAAVGCLVARRRKAIA